LFSIDNVTRPYTPIILSITDTAEDAKKDNDDIDDSNNKSIVSQNSQELHFIIKIYPDGEFTSLLEKMFSENDSEENSSIEVEMGFPRGNFDTLFFQNVDILCLFAAGTGITPFIKIIQYLYVRRKSIPIQKVVLLFFNETCEDVIWTQEFETLAKNEPSWFYFYPVISKPNKSSSETEWNGLTGRISIQLFENCLKSIPALSTLTSSKAMICGSYGFNAACKEVIKAQSVLKFDDPDGIFIFNG
jgi:NAD(P)H-flavin reductase